MKYNLQCSVHPWKETPTGILWIWILSMCDFPWMLSFICQWRGGREQRVKGLRLGGENFCCSVLFYDLKEADQVCWGGVFLTSRVNFEGEGPSLPRGRNSTYECQVVGSRGPQRTKVSVKPAWFRFNMLTFTHALNSLLYTGINKLLNLFADVLPRIQTLLEDCKCCYAWKFIQELLLAPWLRHCHKYWLN